MWIIFSLGGAFLEVIYYALVKKFLKNTNPRVLAAGVYLVAFAILFVLSLVNGIPAIGKIFYPVVLVDGILFALATWLYYKVLKITDLSLALPILSFTPVFLIFISFVFLGEIPCFWGAVGIFLIVIGSYILNIKGSNISLMDPLKKMFINKGMFYMLIVAFLFGISSSLGKIAIQASDPFLAGSITYLVSAIIFIAASKEKGCYLLDVYRDNFLKFLLVASVLSSAAILINFALLWQIVPYVISLKRTSILLSVFGGALIFKEGKILNKTLAALAMTAGAVLIALG